MGHTSIPPSSPFTPKFDAGQAASNNAPSAPELPFTPKWTQSSVPTNSRGAGDNSSRARIAAQLQNAGKATARTGADGSGKSSATSGNVSMTAEQIASLPPVVMDLLTKQDAKIEEQGKIIEQQAAEIKDLKKEIHELKSDISALKDQVSQLVDLVKSQQNGASGGSAAAAHHSASGDNSPPAPPMPLSTPNPTPGAHASAAPGAPSGAPMTHLDEMKSLEETMRQNQVASLRTQVMTHEHEMHQAQISQVTKGADSMMTRLADSNDTMRNM